MPVPELSEIDTGRPRPSPGRLLRRPWLLLMALAAPVAAPAAPLPKPSAEAIPLEQLMAGEFALQAGQLADAAQWSLEAARLAQDDVLLAERATRIAMLANDDVRAAQALELWQKRSPDSLSLQAATASLALREGRLRKARQELLQLLAAPDPRAWRYALVALAGGRDPEAVAKVLGQLVDAGAIPGS